MDMSVMKPQVLQNEINKMLKKGKSLDDICLELFDGAGYGAQDEHSGIRRIVYGKMFNYMESDGRIVSPVWFDWVDLWDRYYGMVQLNGKYNYINIEGELLSPYQWFDECTAWVRGEAVVTINGEKMTIDRQGNIMKY